MLADSVQNNVGAFFGVSGTVVVIVVFFIVYAQVVGPENEKKTAAANLAKQRAAALEAEAARQRAKLLANPVTQLCTDGRHNECNGKVRMDDETIRQCCCTCHGSTSDKCATLGRHDLCSGTVQGAGGTTAKCRCSCHLPKT